MLILGYYPYSSENATYSSPQTSLNIYNFCWAVVFLFLLSEEFSLYNHVWLMVLFLPFFPPCCILTAILLLKQHIHNYFIQQQLRQHYRGPLWLIKKVKIINFWFQTYKCKLIRSCSCRKPTRWNFKKHNCL